MAQLLGPALLISSNQLFSDEDLERIQEIGRGAKAQDAEKTGQFLPRTVAGRAKVMEWLMWQMANIGPMLGQANHFLNAAPEKIPYAINRYVAESARLFKVMDSQLARGEYLAGDYSIADIASYPWVSAAFPLLKQASPEGVGEGKHVQRWIDAIGARPAVQKGMGVPKA